MEYRNVVSKQEMTFYQISCFFLFFFSLLLAADTLICAWIPHTWNQDNLCSIFLGINMFLCDRRLSQLPDTLSSVRPEWWHPGGMCLCFLRIRLAWWRLSGVDRILYLCLARITSITRYSNRPPLPPPPSLSLHAQRHAVPFSEARLLQVPPPQHRLLGPGQCFHLTLPLPCKLLTDTPPAVREHWPCTLEAKLQDPEGQTTQEVSLKLDMKPSGWIQYTLLWLRPFPHRFSHQIMRLWGINVKFNLVMWRSGDTEPSEQEGKTSRQRATSPTRSPLQTSNRPRQLTFSWMSRLIKFILMTCAKQC